MKKIKYYLDTTIFNFVFAEGDTGKKDITVKLFKDLPSISNGIYISDEVINGINRLLGYYEIEICSPEEVIES